MHQPLQLQLFDFPTQPQIKVIYDPYWDELKAQADGIVEQAFLSINAKTEIIFDVDAAVGADRKFCPSTRRALVAPQQNQRVGAQLSFDESPYKSVGAQVISDTKKIAPQHDTKLYDRHTEESPTHWVEKYWVERVGNKYWYYRYCWMEGRKKNRIYIGAVRSPKANLKKQAVLEAILDGQSLQEIIALIRSLRS
ncbi:DUF4102 domain-containing protein [Tolypothrix sp. VBCCA 56010]|uniref:DUF4102 domain-containing protein n=1 Tax=Tolypothrix sp. VBCCA 56010 TaxID=3137731 RepID=UPI003D7E1E49